MAKNYPSNYRMDSRLLELVQITRRAKLEWKEADVFLKEHGFEISRTKYEATKKFIHDSISDRIMYIANTEYADVHLQLLDGMKEQVAEIERMMQKAKEEDKAFLYVRLAEVQIKTMHAVKELYNSSTIVGGIDKMINELKKKAAGQKPEIKN